MLSIEPQAGPAPIIQVINSSRRDLDVGVYYLFDRKILRALAAAHRRGVAVRVIIEGKPYGMKPWQVRREERTIAATGAQWKVAPPRFTGHGNDYSFYHCKYCANGHEVEIGTANFDWSAFHWNREYVYVTRNATVVQAVNAVFNADWNNQRAPAFAHRVLVLSPGTSAAQLLQVIDQSGPIGVESEELGPYALILDALANKGKDLRLILPSSINGEDQRDVAFLRAHGCQVRLLPVKPLYQHSKMITGRSLAFIGSENFTQTSLEDNREMGLLLNESEIGKLQAQFDRDWARAGDWNESTGQPHYAEHPPS
ncbi:MULTISPECIES: phospholipase D-like domain-containing protein [Acidithiobacillus]|uniref:phospholipase D-like domain-containing protein n=1 Tax=Acidithiobacillus TaxID=119977 RepID=UPI00187A8094|nr:MULTISPECIES: phospholipase D-like domain-containing protein [Acidithiobacillus]MBE7567645.1 GTP-binding protein [Acidithiobacillus sp. HP-11]MBU2794735.1 GTP-binding protein [Acidithiobacillus thiooxidans]